MNHSIKAIALSGLLSLSLLSACTGKSAASSSSPSAAAASPYEGTWKTISYNAYGSAMSNEDLGASALMLDADGTGTFAMMSDTEDPIAWQAADQGIEIVYNANKYEAMMNGNVLVLEIDQDMDFYFTRDGAEPKWSAEPQLNAASSAPASAAAASPEAAADVNKALWYGAYTGTFIAGSPSGTMADTYSGEKDPIYGTLANDGSDYLELYFDKTHDETSDPILLSTYVDLSDSTLVPSGEDDWLLDMKFTGADHPVTSAVMTSADPVTIAMTGTYRSQAEGASADDGFTWTIELTRTAPLECALADAPADSKETACLSDLGQAALVSSSKSTASSLIAASSDLPASDYTPGVVTITTLDQLNEFLQSRGTVILTFYTNWCKSCALEEPILTSLWHKYYSNVTFLKANADKINLEFMGKYDVMVVPTTISFRNGTQVDKRRGYLSMAELDQMIIAAGGN